MKSTLLAVLLMTVILINTNAKPFINLNVPFDLYVADAACDDGNATACIILGVKYIEGTEKIKKDEQKGKEFFRKACAYGDQRACTIIRSLKEEKEMESLSTLCKNGDNNACADLEKLKNRQYYLIDGKCSNCNSEHVGTYLYGLVTDPDKEMQAKLDSGEIILGGCFVSKDNPKHRCLNCGADLHKMKNSE